MHPSPSHHDRDQCFEYYVMLPHASDASVLLVREGDAWTLPHFAPDVTDFRVVHHINDYVRARHGMASVVQRCVHHRHDADRGQTCRVYALENLSPASNPPDGGQWVHGAELPSVRLAIPEHREIMRRWLQDVGPETVPELRAPWAHKGWFEAASGWVEAQLERLNIKALAPVVQTRAWALSCIMRLETSIGKVYFKAVPPFMTQEAVVMRELPRQHPELLPPLLATDVERGWMLMPDFGDDLLLHTPDLSRWEEALRHCAQMQVAQVGHVPDWLARGCPDRRLPRMVALIEPLITVATQMFLGSPQGLSKAEIEGLHAIAMKLQLLCANLAGYSVPQTLIHGDLGGNILVQDDRYIFFDWTDVCIAHPFFDMATIIETVFDESVIKNETDVRTRLRDAYLEPWTTYETMPRLVHAFELSTSLGALHQAMSYMWILMNVAEDARWELEHGLVTWLRRLLQLLPPGN